MWVKYLTNFVPEVRIECRCGENNLREASCRRNGTIEEDATTNIANTMKCFTPPLVTGDAESGNGRGWVNELGEFLIQCEPWDKVSGSLLDGKLWVAEWVGSGGGVGPIASKRRWWMSELGMGESESEEREKGEGWWEDHGVKVKLTFHGVWTAQPQTGYTFRRGSSNFINVILQSCFSNLNN